MGLRLTGAADRVHIWLNGVLIGRDWSISPQHTFYLPEGISNTTGDNTLTLGLWRRGNLPDNPEVGLHVYQVLAKHEVRLT